MRVYRSLFDTARQYRESFDVFGTKMSIEWPLVEGEGHVLHTAKQPQKRTVKRLFAPDYAHLLPEPVRHFTTNTFLDCRNMRILRIAIAPIPTEPTPISLLIPDRWKGMADLIPILCTNSFPRCSKTGILFPTASDPPTSPARDCWRTSRQRKAAGGFAFPTSHSARMFIKPSGLGNCLGSVRKSLEASSSFAAAAIGPDVSALRENRRRDGRFATCNSHRANCPVVRASEIFQNLVVKTS